MWKKAFARLPSVEEAAAPALPDEQEDAVGPAKNAGKKQGKKSDAGRDSFANCTSPAPPSARGFI
jgi:hypothetical protein